MIRPGLVLLAALLPGAAEAQLAMFAVANGQEAPVSSIYDFGKIAMGDSKQVVFRIRNQGSVTAQVTTRSVNGAGFSLVNPPPIPFNILPTAFLDLTVAFVSPSAPLNYSANFQVNSISVLLLASSVTAATISSGIGCTGPDPAGGTINFGNVVSGASSTCTYSLRNLNNQSVTVTTFAVSGDGFSGPQGIKTPFTLVAGEFVNFTITFAPRSATPYAGALTIDSRTFQLAGNGTAPPLSTPVLDTQSTPVQSGQQRALSVQLPAPAPFPITGNVTLTYTPDSPLIQDDPTVMFASSGARSIPFSIKQGDTQALLGGQASAIFQTGASSGKIRFSLTASVPIQGDATRIVTVPAGPVAIDTASALKTSGALQISISGLDNTLSADAMTFTFYDLTGNRLNDGTITADFTSAFRDYFSKSTVAGMFRAQVNFAVTGDAGQIGFVDVQIKNPAGSASTSRLKFP
jgi:hypothetical protein